MDGSAFHQVLQTKFRRLCNSPSSITQVILSFTMLYWSYTQETSSPHFSPCPRAPKLVWLPSSTLICQCLHFSCVPLFSQGPTRPIRSLWRSFHSQMRNLKTGRIRSITVSDIPQNQKHPKHSRITINAETEIKKTESKGWLFALLQTCRYSATGLTQLS